MKEDDKARIEAKTKVLAEASANLAQRVYQETTPDEQTTDSAGDGKDDVVDAEFEELKEQQGNN